MEKIFLGIAIICAIIISVIACDGCYEYQQNKNAWLDKQLSEINETSNQIYGHILSLDKDKQNRGEIHGSIGGAFGFVAGHVDGEQGTFNTYEMLVEKPDGSCHVLNIPKSKIVIYNDTTKIIKLDIKKIAQLSSSELGNLFCYDENMSLINEIELYLHGEKLLKNFHRGTLQRSSDQIRADIEQNIKVELYLPFDSINNYIRLN